MSSIMLNYKKIVLTDAHIKKKMNVFNTFIMLEHSFNDISCISPNELNYIKWKNIILLELNEKILFILKRVILSNIEQYQNVFEKVFDNKYTSVKKKTIIIINFNNKIGPSIKVVNGFINYDSIIYKYSSKKELKMFLKSNK